MEIAQSQTHICTDSQTRQQALVKEIDSGPQTVERPEFCLLIDEPELHLHPNLQLKVLDYFRVLASSAHIQIIVATHSPTMVEYASFEELFLLRPVELSDLEQSQLVQVANNEERLAFLRGTFGTTANLTAMQSVVIVEGVAEQDAVKVLPDRKLYRALHSGFDQVTLLPGGGKAECRALLKVLNEVLPAFSNQLQAVALLDRDTEVDSGNSLVRLLPVSMIENFLLDPDSIWEALQSVIERTAFKTVDDVSIALDHTIQKLQQREVDRRTAAELGSAHFFPPSSGEIAELAAAFVQQVISRYAPSEISRATEVAVKKVGELGTLNRRREEFHGKSVLQAFYAAHLHGTGLPKVVFSFETARHARRRRAVLAFFDEFFASLIPAKDQPTETPGKSI